MEDINMDVAVDSGSHIHVDKAGYLHSCYHKCKGVLFSWQFWLGSIFSQFWSFPIEHAIWEKLPPFDIIARLLGL